MADFYSDEGRRWPEPSVASDHFEWAFDQSIRRLLLRVYFTFCEYEQDEVFIMLITGVYFTILKFHRPEPFNRQLQVPRSESGVRDRDLGYLSSEHINNGQLAEFVAV